MIHKSTFNPNFAAIGHFRVPPGLCFKTRVGAQPLIFSQERLRTWPHFESEGFWNSEVVY